MDDEKWEALWDAMEWAIALLYPEPNAFCPSCGYVAYVQADGEECPHCGEDSMEVVP